MSRQSDAASRLGRLNLDSSTGSSSSGGAGAMPVTTRAQVSRDERRQSSSRAPASQVRRQSALPGSSAAPSRRQPPRASTTKRHQLTEDDSEEEEEDSSEEEADEPDHSDPDSSAPATVLNPAHSRTVLRAMFSAFDPSMLSPPEFNLRPETQLHPDSRALRDLADSFAKKVVSVPDLQQQVNVLPLASDLWGRRVSDNLTKRVLGYMSTYNEGQSARADTVWILEEFLVIYRSIHSTLRESPYRQMTAYYGQRLVNLLCYILDFILSKDKDVRKASTAQHYAGGGEQYEFNLYMRFSTQQGRWQPFLDMLDALARDALLRNLFATESTISYLKASYLRQNQRQAYGQRSQSGDDLSRRVMLLLSTLGIQPPAAAP